MPSQLHEALLLLFRNRPALAAELLQEALGAEVPAHAEVRIESAELTQVQPAEYRADLVVLLGDAKPAFGIVVEVQLSRNSGKRFAWPSYVANLRARLKRPVVLLVVTVTEAMARWASRPIELGWAGCGCGASGADRECGRGRQSRSRRGSFEVVF